MSANYDIKTDLREAAAMAKALGDYVRGNQLYGNAGGGFFSRMPSLTIGALLMRLRRLGELRAELSTRDASTLDDAIRAWETTRETWRMHYEEKLKQEANSRLDAMQTFFRECADSAANCRNNYRPELLRRTIVQEVIFEMQDLNVMDVDLQQKLIGTDGKLRSFLADDQFQWSDSLEAIYPSIDYWWLYQKPPQVGQ